MDDPDKIIQALIASTAPVTVFLVNGVKLQGVLTAQMCTPQYVPIMYTLERAEKQQIVMAHAISTIMPA